MERRGSSCGALLWSKSARFRIMKPCLSKHLYRRRAVSHPTPSTGKPPITNGLLLCTALGDRKSPALPVGTPRASACKA
jgi:hypothetical protein